MFYSKTWKGGDKFKITVQYNWQSGTGNQGPSSDYTVSAYSLQTLEIYDKDEDDDDRKTNQIHMDGACPSGLQDTTFSYCTDAHSADKQA